MCSGVVVDEVVGDGGGEVADRVVAARGGGGVVAGVVAGDGGSDTPTVAIIIVFDGGIEVNGVVLGEDISGIVVVSSLVRTLAVL